MFAYCGNNPVNRVDPTGQFWKELWDAFTQTIQQASGYFAVAAGVSAVVTTIEQVNATGILTAIPTGGTHVTVIPTNGTVNQWMSQGQSSIWLQTLSLIVVEWDGGY